MLPIGLLPSPIVQTREVWSKNGISNSLTGKALSAFKQLTASPTTIDMVMGIKMPVVLVVYASKEVQCRSCRMVSTRIDLGLKWMGRTWPWRLWLKQIWLRVETSKENTGTKIVVQASLAGDCHFWGLGL